MAITIDGADNKLEIGANATGPSSLRLYEDTDNGTNYVSIIAPSAVTSNRTITLPDNTGTIITTGSTGAVTSSMLASGVSGTGPAFSAYVNQTNNLSTATYTKVTANTEEFDTNSNYDNTTNYRFTPTVAGYYQITGHVGFSGALSAGQNIAFIYKNGSLYKSGTNYVNGTTNSSQAVVSALVYCNGSTDYIELYARQNSGSTININNADPAYSYFQGFLARSA